MFRASDADTTRDTGVASVSSWQSSAVGPDSDRSARSYSAWSRASGAGLIERGIITYICGLLLIAGLTITGHFLTDSIVREQESTARVVNLSGRQRMLSQRIAKLALERAAHLNIRPDAEINAALQQAITAMAASNQVLVNGSAAQRILPPPPETLAIYEQRPYLLDIRIHTFLDQARRVAALPSDALTTQNTDLLALERNAQEPLLQSLDAAVSAYQATSEAAIRRLRSTLLALALLMLLTLLAEAVWLYRPLFTRLEAAQRRLFDIGRTDPLTGCLNRRAFSLEAQRALVGALLEEKPLSILMADIDHFKSVNDRFGHPAGDLVINSVVATLLHGTQTKSGNIVGRMGGEEFAVLLRGATMDEAVAVAEQLRATIEATVIQHSAAEQIAPVTISAGVASLQSDDDTSIFQLLARADKALYRAKRTGRNRVTADISAVLLEPIAQAGA